MRTEITHDGNLKLLADNYDRSELAKRYNRENGGYYLAEGFVAEMLSDEVDFVPEFYYGHLGALTSSPIIAEQFYLNDDNDPVFEGEIYWYPGYMVSDPYEQLKNKGYVVFTKAD